MLCVVSRLFIMTKCLKVISVGVVGGECPYPCVLTCIDWHMYVIPLLPLCSFLSLRESFGCKKNVLFVVTSMVLCVSL